MQTNELGEQVVSERDFTYRELAVHERVIQFGVYHQVDWLIDPNTSLPHNLPRRKFTIGYSLKKSEYKEQAMKLMESRLERYYNLKD